jgi:DNA-binding transcriptional LysR family regulator
MPGGFYVRGGHPLLKRESIQVADMMPFGMGTGRLSASISALLSELMGLPEGSKPPVAMECDDVHILKRIAIDTDTVIIGTDDLFAQELAAGTIEALVLRDLPTPHATLGIVTLAGRTPSPVAAYAMDFLAGLAERLEPA